MARCWRVLTTALVVCASLAVAARGQPLLEVDGVELHGNARLVVAGGGTCKVLESDTSYEARKENHGAPMDIWRLDFTVRNGSGRWLDHLIARYRIESAWPECTNWDGPDAVGQPIEWAGSAGHIQESGRHVVAPGQALTETKYFIVLQGDPEPRFANWSMDFDFAAAAPSDDSAGQAGSAAAPADQLPPEVQADLHLRKAEQAVREGDAATAREAMERLAAVQAEHGLEPAPEEHYRTAQAWAAAGEPQRALEAAVRYLQSGGRDSEHYTEALDLINRGGSLEPGPAAGNAEAGRAGPAGTSAAEAPRAGESREFDGMEFVWISAGEFLMGSTSSEAYDRESPVTRVRISRGYWLGKHEVTQAEWQAVTGTNPAHFSGCGSCPVERVSWDDAQGFIRQLNGRSGGSRYRLPTEAEWEHAARAGTAGDRYAPNLDAIAWYDENSGDRTHPVGQKAPNAWGLHDMLGNVWEWVQDWYGDYPGGAVTDPGGPGSGSYRLPRGGSWLIYARDCRASYRDQRRPRQPQLLPRLPPAEDGVALCALTLSPSAERSDRGRAGSRDGGRGRARTERGAARRGRGPLLPIGEVAIQWLLWRGTRSGRSNGNKPRYRGL